MGKGIYIRRVRKPQRTCIVSIPKAVVDRYDIGPGEYLVFATDEIPGGLTIRKAGDYFGPGQTSNLDTE